MSLKQDSFKKLRKEKNKWKVETPEDFEEREDGLFICNRSFVCCNWYLFETRRKKQKRL